MKEDDWKPGRWFRVVDPNGEIWCETSDKEEALRAMRQGDRFEQQYECVYTEWREVAV